MIVGHRMKKKIDNEEFFDQIGQYQKDQITTTKHTFFRLEEKQRKIFKDTIIQEYILAKVPMFVGLQHNGCHAVFYDYKKNEAMKAILDIRPNSIEIVTFYITSKNEIPRI